MRQEAAKCLRFVYVLSFYMGIPFKQGGEQGINGALGGRDPKKQTNTLPLTFFLFVIGTVLGMNL